MNVLLALGWGLVGAFCLFLAIGAGETPGAAIMLLGCFAAFCRAANRWSVA